MSENIYSSRPFLQQKSHDLYFFWVTLQPIWHSFSQLEANSRLTRQPVLPVRNLNKCFFQYCTYLKPVKPSWASTIGEEAEEEEAEAGAEIEAATEEEVELDGVEVEMER